MGNAGIGTVAPGGPRQQDTVTSNLPAHSIDAVESALDTAAVHSAEPGRRTACQQLCRDRELTVRPPRYSAACHSAATL
jgi:hypothetical protein